MNRQGPNFVQDFTRSQGRLMNDNSDNNVTAKQWNSETKIQQINGLKDQCINESIEQQINGSMDQCKNKHLPSKSKTTEGG